MGRSVSATAALRARYNGPFKKVVYPDGPNTQDGQIQLSSQTPGTFELHPAYQRHEYALPESIQVEETVFVPSITTPMQAHEHLGDDLARHLLRDCTLARPAREFVGIAPAS